MHTPLALALAAALLALSAPLASAVTVYDEAVDGDASGEVGSATPVDVFGTGGPYSIIGTLDGGATGVFNDGPDEQDSYLFTGTDTFNVDFSVSEGSVSAFLNDFGLNFVERFDPETDVLTTTDAGSYKFGLIPSGNQGTAIYQLDITVEAAVVPLPAGAVLLLSGLGGPALLRRRTGR